MTSQRTLQLCLALFAILLSNRSRLFGQDSPALKERLRRAVAQTSLDQPGMNPWHLTMTYQLLDPKGFPTQEGTIEELWVSPRLYKIVYTTPSFAWYEMRNHDGVYKSSGKQSPDYLLRILRSQVVHPMPEMKEIDEAVPVLEQKQFGNIPLDCLMLASTTKSSTPVDFGIYPTFCLDHDQNSLRLSTDSGSEVISRTTVGTFAGKSVALDQGISRNDLLAAKAHLTVLENKRVTEADFLPTADMMEVNDHPVKLDELIGANNLISQAPAVYPMRAKALHKEGEVVVKALIGTDGRVLSLKLLSTADSDMAIAALSSIRQWIYKPYLFNGVPTSVETIVRFRFMLGHR